MPFTYVHTVLDQMFRTVEQLPQLRGQCLRYEWNPQRGLWRLWYGRSVAQLDRVVVFMPYFQDEWLDTTLPAVKREYHEDTHPLPPAGLKLPRGWLKHNKDSYRLLEAWVEAHPEVREVLLIIQSQKTVHLQHLDTEGRGLNHKLKILLYSECGVPNLINHQHQPATAAKIRPEEVEWQVDTTPWTDDRFRVEAQKLCTLSTTDPLVRAHNWQAGDLVRLTYPHEYCGTAVDYFRVDTVR